MSSMFRASNRINLYPAAPIRLATMLRAWTITEKETRHPRAQALIDFPTERFGRETDWTGGV